MNKNSMWKFGTREIVYSAIGAALYGVLSWVFNSIQLPGTILGSFRPAVAIPMFMGVAFGPLVGFFSGGVGNVIGDLLSGYGFFWNWDIGNGLMGLVPGLLPYVGVTEIKAPRDYIFVIVAAVVAAFVGIGFAALTDVYVTRTADMAAAINGELIPIGGVDAINGGILTPILAYAWNAYRSRSGR